jgi:hypothetical protein
MRSSCPVDPGPKRPQDDHPLSVSSDCGMEGDGWTVTQLAADATPDADVP